MGKKTGVPPKPDADRFWPKVCKAGPAKCWLWKAGKNGDGYGNFTMTGGRSIGAHRMSWILATGSNPDLQVLHQCDTRNCVNPAHLFLGTQQDNMKDMFAKGRDSYGERHPISKLTTAEALAIRNSGARRTKDLAAEFRISEKQVGHIRNGKSWRHLAR